MKSIALKCTSYLFTEISFNLHSNQYLFQSSFIRRGSWFFLSVSDSIKNNPTSRNQLLTKEVKNYRITFLEACWNDGISIFWLSPQSFGNPWSYSLKLNYYGNGVASARDTSLPTSMISIYLNKITAIFSPGRCLKMFIYEKLSHEFRHHQLLRRKSSCSRG